MGTILPYESRYQSDFRRLNLEWLDAFGLTESHDLMILDNPVETIINRGGFIWLAIESGTVIGTAALMKEKEGVYELAKMSVVPAEQGRGISKRLIETCIAKAREQGAEKIILFSNHQLLAALRLYENYGFRHVGVTNSPFTTADVKMEFIL